MEREPSLNEMDDYQGKESNKKRRLVYGIIIGILIIGAIFTYFKYRFSDVDDQMVKDYGYMPPAKSAPMETKE